MAKEFYTQLIRTAATRLGFASVGFARAAALTEEGRRLEAWLNQGQHGRMDYLANHFEKRIDPRKLLPGTKSVVVFTYNYFPEEQQPVANAPKLAKYAYGKDYHFVLKSKLRELVTELEENIGSFQSRYFVDSAPVMEREWAARGGLGWIGKNTLLIHPRRGSYYFLAVLLVDLELEYDSPLHDYCGRCSRCVDACPTEAIAADGYTLDASRCISYLTIELKEAIPDDFAGKMDDWMFGCDVCQDVCPWNRFAEPHQEPAFKPHPDLLQLSRDDWMQLERETFNELFRKSAVKRTKYQGLMRNLQFLDKKPAD